MVAMHSVKLRALALLSLTALAIAAGYGAIFWAKTLPGLEGRSITPSRTSEQLRALELDVQDLKVGQTSLRSRVSEILSILKDTHEFEPLLGRIAKVQLGVIEFDSGSAEIGEEDHAELGKIAQKIEEYDSPVLIVGLADSCGAQSRNLNLSEQRAQAVAHALHEDLEEIEFYVRGLGENVGEFLDQKCDSAEYRTARVIGVDTQVAKDIIVLVPNRS